MAVKLNKGCMGHYIIPKKTGWFTDWLVVGIEQEELFIYLRIKKMLIMVQEFLLIIETFLIGFSFNNKIKDKKNDPRRV